MSKLFTDFEMTKDEYNSFEEWLKQHDKEVVQDYIDKVVEELEEIIEPEAMYMCRVAKGRCFHLDDDTDCVDCVAKRAIEIVRGEKNDD